MLGNPGTRIRLAGPDRVLEISCAGSWQNTDVPLQIDDRQQGIVGLDMAGSEAESGVVLKQL